MLAGVLLLGWGVVVLFFGGEIFTPPTYLSSVHVIAICEWTGSVLYVAFCFTVKLDETSKGAWHSFVSGCIAIGEPGLYVFVALKHYNLFQKLACRTVSLTEMTVHISDCC